MECFRVKAEKKNKKNPGRIRLEITKLLQLVILTADIWHLDKMVINLQHFMPSRNIL